jgi:hypothetical protein
VKIGLFLAQPEFWRATESLAPEILLLSVLAAAAEARSGAAAEAYFLAKLKN